MPVVLRCEGQTSARVGPDDGEAAVGEEHRRGQDQPEGRQAEQRRVVIVAREDDQDAGAEAQQAAGSCAVRSRSDSQEKERRPMKPATVSRIIILAASCGVTFSSSTNSDGAHSAMP